MSATPAAIKTEARARIASWAAEQTRYGNPPRAIHFRAIARRELGFARFDLREAARVAALVPTDRRIHDLREQLGREFSTDRYRDRDECLPRRERIVAEIERLKAGAVVLAKAA